MLLPIWSMQHERDRLLTEVENLSANSDEQAQKLQDLHAQKLKALEAQVFILYFCSMNMSMSDLIAILLIQLLWHLSIRCFFINIFLSFLCMCQIQDLKKKQENQVQLTKQKQKSDEAARKLLEEIQCMKAQKVKFWFFASFFF